VSRVGGGGVGRARGVELGGVDIGVAAGQEHGVAALDELHDLGWSLVERDADGLASGLLDGALVLRQGAVRVFGIG